MRVYLIRHGQTDWNIEGRLQGHTDIPLNNLGMSQASKLGTAFREVPVDRILCSDLVRARQTADTLARATGASIAIHPEIRERSFGEFEGMHYLELASRIAERAAQENRPLLETRPPGGESFADLWSRTLPFSDDLNRSNDRVAVVMHGGPCASILAQLIQANLPTVRAFRFGNTSVTELERREDEGLNVILRFDDTSHLV